MANKYPRQFDNWDKIDPIHFVEAVALWCNINPNDLVKKSLATDKIKDAFQLLLDGKSDGYLGQPFPDDEVFCPDSYWFLKKKDLKAFAKYCDETPVFLFSQKGEEKKYNVPPQPKKTVPDFLKLLKHDSAFVVHEIMMMLFGYDGMEFIILPWQKHIPIYQAKINHIFLLLKEAIIIGRFGACDLSQQDLLTLLLPAPEVIAWLKEKQLPDLVQSYGYKIDRDFYDLMEHLIENERQNGESGRKQSIKSKRHQESNEHKKQIREIAKELWKENEDLTIQDVILSDAINKITKSNCSNYSESTLRNWIKDLALSNKPGRRARKFKL